MIKSTLVIPPLAVLALTGLASAQAPPSRLVEMEIVDTPKQGAVHTTHFAMAVIEDHGWFSSNTSDSTTNTHASARLDRDRAANVVLKVEVQRRGPGELDINSAKIIAGQTTPRTLMGRVERDNGVSELFVLVH
jgi:hypothetical protein